MAKTEEYNEATRFLNDTLYQLKNGYICYIYSKEMLEEVLKLSKCELEYEDVGGYYVVYAKDKERKNIY